MSFRDDIFQLCKTIQKNDTTKEISSLVHDFSVVKEGEELISHKSEFKQVASHSHNQFYGYLYTNEHTQDYISIFPHISPLTMNEYEIFAKAHATIISLIDGCLSEFKINFPSIYFALNPYSKYKPIKENSAHSILRPENYNKAVDSFKSSPLYQKLYNSNINVILEQIKINDINMMFDVLEKEINNCPLDKLPESIDSFMKCIYTDFKEIQDILMAEIILILGLKKSLENACSLLFTALVGEDLIVLNNDNIISIDKNFSNSLHKVLQLLCDDIFLTRHTNTVGDILLIDCFPNDTSHIHEFGFITSYTASWSQEDGNTSKLTTIIVDDSLNPIYALTNKIIEKEFPPVVKQQPPSTHELVNIPNKTKKINVSRNDKCPCGSGLKYKFCCGKND